MAGATSERLAFEMNRRDDLFADRFVAQGWPSCSSRPEHIRSEAVAARVRRAPATASPASARARSPAVLAQRNWRGIVYFWSVP